MSNNAALATFPATYNPAPRPLAMAGDEGPGKGLAVLGAVAGFMIAAGGLVAGKLVGGGLGRPPAGGTVSATASASPSASAAASAAPAARAPSASPSTVPVAAASGGCPAGMVLVPAGKFLMGSDDAEFKAWTPAHEVTLDAFCIDLFEVTAGDYKACVDKGECKPPSAVPDYPKPESATPAEHEKTRTALAELCTFGKAGLERHPINCISWEPADAYCKLQKKRLPTEAEWEFAVRGPENHKFPWGNDPGDHTFMNACGTECTNWQTAHEVKESPRIYEEDDGFFGTSPVGSFPKGKTRSGAYDLTGNVWEWTADWFDNYKAQAATNPKGAPKGTKKTIRGGAFNSGSPMWVSAAFRYSQFPAANAPGIGFRCVGTP
jgi:formylglycine-generating enzyme required for sulfatase activity